MRVLLISTNRERRPSFAIPIGIAHLQTALVNAGHDAHILDLCFQEDEQLAPTVKEKLREFPPDLIGVSIRNIDNETFLQYRGNLGDVRIVVDACRHTMSAPLVLGGSGFSLMPEDIMRKLDVHLGVVGEGEAAIVALAEALQHVQPFENIPGLVTLYDGVYTDNGPSRVIDMATVAPPNNFFPDPRYFSTQVVGPQPTYGVQTKRGCAFRCSYCPVPSIEGKRFRLRRPEDIVGEIQHLQRIAGLQRIFFTDSIINIPKRHAIAFCTAMIEAKLNIRWMAYANPLQFSQELADLFAQAGCEILNFGLDAACPEMLESMQKDFTVEDIIAATAFSKQAGIRTIHSLLLGGPNETVETVKKTLDVMSLTAPHLLIIAIGIRMYPQTPIWNTLRSTLPESKNANMLDPVFYLDPRLDRDARAEMLKVLRDFINTHPNIAVKMNFTPDNLVTEQTEKALEESILKGVSIS